MKKVKNQGVVRQKNAGFENYFYAFEQNDGTRDAQTLEDAFGELEDKAAPVIRKIVE